MTGLPAKRIGWDGVREAKLLGRAVPEGDLCEDRKRCRRVLRAMLAMQRASWEQGVSAQACLEEGEGELALLLAREAWVRQDEKGRLAQLGNDLGVTDCAAAGEPLLFAALETGDPALAEAAERLLLYLLHDAPRSADGVLFHQEEKGELWSDSFYMAPPFLALAGEPREAMRQLRGLHLRLYLPGKRLVAHRYAEGQGRLVRAAAWGVGNGWALSGMARTLRFLPAALASEKRELGEKIRELLSGCLAHERPDGLFHDVVDDPGTFVEVNLSQMIAATIYRGVPAGYLDPRLLARAEKMRASVVARVDGSGLVQGVCGSPGFDHPGTAAEGQAFFLMMEAARRAL